MDRNLIYSNINNMSLRDVNSIEIVKRFDFDSSLARMSVIVSDKLSASGWRVQCKGSPEKMHDICIRDSIPVNYAHLVDSQARQGLRVISFAFKDIKIRRKKVLADLNNIGRNQAESDLVFCGFAVMKNPLKIQTTSSIVQLKNADIGCYMATGDHILTAISVSRECQILSSKSIVGEIKFNKIKNFPNGLIKNDNKLYPNINQNYQNNSNTYSMNDYIYIEYENKTEFFNDIVTNSKIEKNISKLSLNEKVFAIEGTNFIKLLECINNNQIDLNVFLFLFKRIIV